jgi:hypothetical protein
MPQKTNKFPGRRKRYIIIASVAVVAISVALYQAAENNPYKNSKEWNFDSYKENMVPTGLMYTQTDSEKARWVVRSDESAPSKPHVFARLSSNSSQLIYPMVIMPEGGYSSFKASVKLKIISGETAQAAGLTFRFQDTGSYFVLVADAVNDRFSLCRADVNKLICTQDVGATIDNDKWYTVTAHVAAQGIAGYLDDKLLIQRYDKHYLSGAIGLWTKGDTIAYFDDLKIDY